MGYSISPTLNLLMTSRGEKNNYKELKRYSKYCTLSDLSKKGFLLDSSPTHSSPALTFHQLSVMASLFSNISKDGESAACSNA